MEDVIILFFGGYVAISICDIFFQIWDFEMISRSCRTSDVLQETMLLRKKKDLMQKDRIHLVWEPKHFLLVFFVCILFLFFQYNYA
jgi:hypothetical protein